MCVCVYVCVCMYVCVCVHVCAGAFVSVHVQTFTWTCPPSAPGERHKNTCSVRVGEAREMEE